MTRLHSVALAAILSLPLGAVAFAQPVPAPTDPNEPYKPADPVPTTPPPPTVPAEPPAPPPPPSEPTVIVNPPPRATVVTTEPGYETVQDPFNAPLFASGAVMFAASYGASVIAAASVDKSEREIWADRLYVPVVGPWLALDDHGACPIELPRCDDETTTKVLLVADGVVQAAGVVTMFAGLLSPSYHQRPIRTAKLDTKVRIRPTVVGRGGSGVTVFGRW